MKIPASIALSSDKSSFELLIEIPWSEESTLLYDHLCFSLVRPFSNEQLTGGTLIERQGDWHRIALAQPLSPTSPISIAIHAPGPMMKATDYPEGMYLELGKERLEVAIECPVTRNFEQPNWRISDKAIFIPHCQVTQGSERVLLPDHVWFDGELWANAWFERLAKRLNHVVSRNEQGGWRIEHVKQLDLSTDFQLDISAEGAKLLYRDLQGFYAGQAFLLQFYLQLIKNKQMYSVTLMGSPAFTYRGVHLDVVRHFFSAQTISDWLDIFALFQYKQFHWHLTDDDGWRVPSDAYPALNDIASIRGPDKALPPQMGSGLHDYQGLYTKEEIRQVVSQADELGLTVIPEMDLPGHARALLKALPSLQEPDDLSEYLSVQFHNDNVINPAYGPTLEVITGLISEWTELFPGPLFHIGADEVPKGAWTHSPAVLNWADKTKQPIENIQGLALSTIEQHLKTLGKTMAGWEEVVEGGGVSTNTWIYSWQGIEAGIKAASAGHKTVMTPAQYCYLDLAVTDKHDDPGYYWAGTVNLEKAFRYRPLEGVPEECRANVQGIQMCLWSEIVHSKEEAEYMWFPRLLAGAEVAWGSNTNLTFSAFETSVRGWIGLISELGLSVRSEKDGW